MKKVSVIRMAQLALFTAILVIMGFTPLGSLPLGGPIVATLAGIPVVIGAILLSTKSGIFLGGMFGLISMIWFSMFAPPTAFVFSPLYSFQLAGDNIGLAFLYALFSILICFVPRILIGVISGTLFRAVHKRTGKVTLAAGVAGIAGSLTNTLLVLLGILVCFAAPYAAAAGNETIWFLLGTSILINGIPEAIVTPIVTIAVTAPLYGRMNKIK